MFLIYIVIIYFPNYTVKNNLLNKQFLFVGKTSCNMFGLATMGSVAQHTRQVAKAIQSSSPWQNKKLPNHMAKLLRRPTWTRTTLMTMKRKQRNMKKLQKRTTNSKEEEEQNCRRKTSTHQFNKCPVRSTHSGGCCKTPEPPVTHNSNMSKNDAKLNDIMYVVTIFIEDISMTRNELHELNELFVRWSDVNGAEEEAEE